MSVRRPRSVYCSPAERDAIRERAAGSTVSGFVMARALEDDGPAALTAEERAELHAGLPMLTGLVDALCEALSGEATGESTADGTTEDG